MGNSQRPSGIFIHLIFGLVFVPSLVLYSGQDRPSQFLFVTCLAFALVIVTARFLRLKRFSTPKISEKRILSILLVLSILTVVGVLSFGGAQFLNFDFSAVYDIRREAASTIPGIFGYLNSITAKIFIPFGVILSLIARRRGLLAIFFLMSVAIFALTSQKSPLFYPLIAVFFFYTGHLGGAKKYFLLALISIVCLGAWDFSNFEGGGEWNSWFGSLFVNRAILVPANLNALYVEYFSEHENYYWASSKISLGLVRSTYELVPSNMIGLAYFGNSDMSANTGWIGSGFAHAGYVGVVIYSVLLGGIFSLLDAYAKSLSPRIVIALFASPVITMITSSDMTEMLITNGLTFALLILIFLNPKGGEVKNEKNLLRA